MTIHFHRDLEVVKSHVLDMGGLVEAMVNKAISALIGYYLDQAFHTSPWLVVIFLVLGAIAGFIQLVRGLDRLEKSE